MKISYNWLRELIPGLPGPQQLSAILTSVGLEVEEMEQFEEIPGSLAGLLVGEVISCEKHPAADKLKVTVVDTGAGKTARIVCGAPNVAIGQKVVVAAPGTTIFPLNGEPVTLKKATIRGIESEGMICAEDEIGIGNNHEGIIILPAELINGLPAFDYFQPAKDWIFEIGLTPNRIDAMSHIGVARDIKAWLSHHRNETVNILPHATAAFMADNNNLALDVEIKNTSACERYSGVSIANIKVGPSPKWMQIKLKSIGVRPVNNIVDITNFILHETGQPLHAYDLQAITGKKIIVEELPPGTPFITLDEKERLLQAGDLMICNGLDEPMCIGGVFGGLLSGVKSSTTNIFLESAWFNPGAIRRTSLRHNLRTDAATRFEKGVNIDETAGVLKRAAMLIKELAGGEIASELVDVYPNPRARTRVTLEDEYLTRLTGKEYNRNEVKGILQTLGFIVEEEDPQSLTVLVPFSKPDVTLPADVVEEVIRIDGFDNIEIPAAITITPALENNVIAAAYSEKVANYLTGAGFSEIFTNSITNSKYYDESALKNVVKIVNSLSSDLDIMRPSLMETGLESVAHNLNRRNHDLLFFEFGTTYAVSGVDKFSEKQHLSLYVSGNKTEFGWKEKTGKTDLYYLKGVCQNIAGLCGIKGVTYGMSNSPHLDLCLTLLVNGEVIGEIGTVNKGVLRMFDIRQPVLFADLDWQSILRVAQVETVFEEIPKFPSVLRDLSLVVDKNTSYAQLENVIAKVNIGNLKNIKLFDVFESDKLGAGKKAFAITLTFIDTEKTMTDKEIDGWMQTIIESFKNELNAEIRK